MSTPPPDAPQPQPPGPPAHPPPAHPPEPWQVTAPVPERRRPLLEAVVAAAGVVVLAGFGAPLGWLWSWLAPDVPVEMTSDGPVLVDPQPEQYFAADGWFTWLGLAFGLLAAVACWYLLRRLRGPVGLLVVIAGGVGAALLAWYVGRHVGLAEYQRLIKGAPVGSHFGKPPDLRSEELKLKYGFLPVIRGALLVPAFAAAATYTMMAGWSRYATLRAETEPPPEPPALPAGAVSWGSADWPAPTAAPAPPGSGAAEPPRD